MSFEPGNQEWKKRKHNNGGRKPKAVQERYLQLLMERCSEKDWIVICDSWIAHAKAGRDKARSELVDRILGKIPERRQHTGANGGPIKFIVRHESVDKHE